MANFEPCILFVIGLEDTHPSGKVTEDSDGLTRFGLLDRWNPGLVIKGFYTMPVDEALVLAKSYYRIKYWNYIQGDKIILDVIAAQLLSIAVNDGVVTAVKIAQRMLGVDRDGMLGINTLNAINTLPSDIFLNKFDAAAKAHYNDIVVKYPAKQKYLQGWYNRVDAINHFETVKE
jgi:lysozyme family protein